MIQTEQRAGDWIAWAYGDKRIRESGETEAEAIGRMFISLRNRTIKPGTIEELIRVLGVIASTVKDGPNNTTFIDTGDDGVLYLYTEDVLPESKQGKELLSLGCVYDEEDGGYMW